MVNQGFFIQLCLGELLEQILKQLQPGETFELKNTYIGDKQQLFACVIVNRLTEKQLQKRRAKITEKEKSKNRT